MSKDSQDWDNDDLDRFFRKSLAEGTHPYQADDWEKMKILLESHEVDNTALQNGRNRINWFSIFFYSLFTGALLYFGFLHLKSSTKGDYSGLLTTEVRQVTAYDVGIGAFHTQHFMPSVNVAFKSTVSRKATLTNSENEWKDPVPTGSKLASNPHIKEDIVENTLLDTGTSRGSFDEVNERSFASIEDLRHKHSREKPSPLPEGLEAPTISQGVRSLGNKVLRAEEQATIGKQNKLYSRFSLAFILSPDISGWNSMRADGLGRSAGLNLEYFIQNNLSLNIGALHSLKRYYSYVDDQSGGYASPSPSFRLDADCWVMDIPFNVRFYGINGQSGRAYISSGVSSYLMINEKYRLDNGSGGMGYPHEYEVKNQNQHYFGVLNLSAGYERKVGENWTVQVEPYMKLPLTGIGEHEINLRSTGIWIGIKHRW